MSKRQRAESAPASQNATVTGQANPPNLPATDLPPGASDSPMASSAPPIGTAAVAGTDGPDPRPERRAGGRAMGTRTPSPFPQDRDRNQLAEDFRRAFDQVTFTGLGDSKFPFRPKPSPLIINPYPDPNPDHLQPPDSPGL